MRENVRRWVLMVAVVFLLTGCSSNPQPTGTLQGHVTIGPLVPVVREGELEPTPAPEVYAARKIVVYEKDGATVAAQVDIDAQGNYAVGLPAGSYVVDINRLGIDSAAGLPTEVIVRAGEVTVLDVDIDTGIR